MKFHAAFFFCAVMGAVMLLAGCAGVDTAKAPLVLKSASYADLPGWAEDDHAAALTAFQKSCARMVKQDPQKQAGPGPAWGVIGDWQPACKALSQTPQINAKAFFEAWFAPWKATAGGREDTGLFTGYYEAALHGSHRRHGPYQTPLYERPADLVMVELGEFRDELKGQRIAGRVKDGKLKPYEDRAAIEAGKLPPAQQKVLVWVDDPVDAFFLHIQGSGRVVMDDGTSLRAGYDGQNGHVYYAIGRELIKRGALQKEEVSMQSIRAWLDAHPDQAADLMNLNKSYIFFRKLAGDGPDGAEGVALTAGRSLAIDRTQMPYGVPIWLDINAPVPGENDLRRLVVAQDTGGAIIGPVRGDFFWGYGERATHNAGLMKARGRYWLLLPRSINPAP